MSVDPTICLSLQNAKVEKEHNSHKSDLLLSSNKLNKFQSPSSNS